VAASGGGRAADRRGGTPLRRTRADRVGGFGVESGVKAEALSPPLASGQGETLVADTDGVAKDGLAIAAGVPSKGERAVEATLQGLEGASDAVEPAKIMAPGLRLAGFGAFTSTVDMRL